MDFLVRLALYGVIRATSALDKSAKKKRSITDEGEDDKKEQENLTRLRELESCIHEHKLKNDPEYRKAYERQQKELHEKREKEQQLAKQRREEERKIRIEEHEKRFKSDPKYRRKWQNKIRKQEREWQNKIGEQENEEWKRTARKSKIFMGSFMLVLILFILIFFIFGSGSEHVHIPKFLRDFFPSR